eukprot:15434157-Alexandrium_andersonii.AAC.1
MLRDRSGVGYCGSRSCQDGEDRLACPRALAAHPACRVAGVPLLALLEACPGAAASAFGPPTSGIATLAVSERHSWPTPHRTTYFAG